MRLKKINNKHEETKTKANSQGQHNKNTAKHDKEYKKKQCAQNKEKTTNKAPARDTHEDI